MGTKFLTGAATAAHQVEGNNVHSDYWLIENLEHSDFVEPSGTAVDHYTRYAEDIALMAKAGLNCYRFSIEWARVEPVEGEFCLSEIEHYQKVIDCCYENGISPIVTLHHFSSPAWLIGKGGWGKEYVVSAFAKYARFVAKKLGNKLPYICTINEANMGGQLNKVIADMMNSNKRAGGVQVGTNTGVNLETIRLGMLEQAEAFHCAPSEINNFLKPRKPEQERIVMWAHQAAKKTIKEICPQAKVGLTLSLFDYQPTADGETMAQRLWQEDFGWYLPYIEEDDFLGIQNYSRKIVDADGAREPAADVPITQMGYEDYPASIGNVTAKVSQYFKGELIVTENGLATADDDRRCVFIKEAYDSVLAAKRAGANVQGYCYWSLLDNFEWQAGYGKTFGLIAVDRTTQARYPKKSLSVLGSLAE